MRILFYNTTGEREHDELYEATIHSANSWKIARLNSGNVISVRNVRTYFICICMVLLPLIITKSNCNNLKELRLVFPCRNRISRDNTTT